MYTFMDEARASVGMRGGAEVEATNVRLPTAPTIYHDLPILIFKCSHCPRGARSNTFSISSEDTHPKWHPWKPHVAAALTPTYHSHPIMVLDESLLIRVRRRAVVHTSAAALVLLPEPPLSGGDATKRCSLSGPRSTDVRTAWRYWRAWHRDR
jgi:hypothetical protein